MQCDFTLMTIGDYRGGSVTPAPAAAPRPSPATAERAPSRQSTARPTVQPKTATMPPPSQPLSRSFTKEPQSQRTQRPSPPPPKGSLDPESLFLPVDEDDDRIWGEKNYDVEQDTLGWDASANNVNTLSLFMLSTYTELGLNSGWSTNRSREYFKITTISGLAGRPQ